MSVSTYCLDVKQDIFENFNSSLVFENVLFQAYYLIETRYWYHLVS